MSPYKNDQRQVEIHSQLLSGQLTESEERRLRGELIDLQNMRRNGVFRAPRFPARLKQNYPRLRFQT